MSAVSIDQIVRTFVENGGCVVCLSHDPLIHKTLANALHRTLGLPSESLHLLTSPNKTRESVAELRKSGTSVVLLVERTLEGKPNTHFIRTIREAFPELLIIALITDPSKDTVAYLHELGTRNIIVKPVSVGNMLEKLAFTIEPQDEIGRLLDLGKKLVKEKKFDSAMSVIKKIMVIKPMSPAGFMLQGDIFAGQGETDRAIGAYSAAQTHAEFYLEPIGKMARLLKKLDPAKALDCLKRMDWISPLNSVRKAEIGTVHLDQDERDAAKEYFDKSLEIAGKEAMELKASIARHIAESAEKSAPELAEIYHRMAIDSKGGHLNRDDLPSINKLGIQLRNTGQWQEAIGYYDQALKVLPHDENLLYNKGLAYLKGKKQDKALDCFDRAMKSNAEFYKLDDTVALNIGNLYFRKGRLKDAEIIVRHVHAKDPDNKMAEDLLAQITRQLS